MPSSQNGPQPCGRYLRSHFGQELARPALVNDGQIGLDTSVPEGFESGQGLHMPGDGRKRNPSALPYRR